MNGHSGKMIPLILAVVLVGGGLFAILQHERIGLWLAGDAVEREGALEREALKGEIEELEDELASVREEMDTLSPDVSFRQEIEVFGANVPVPVTESVGGATSDVCVDLNQQMESLFVYLDGRDYMAGYALPDGSYAHFSELIDQLWAQPPVVERETDNLLRVLKNSAHFFRVMGKDNTRLVIDILSKEGAITESSFSLLYKVMEAGENCEGRGLGLRMPFRGAYEYAGFFLNTLGGASYLLRRDSRVRMLAQYYSILVIDEANRRKLNEYGIDIRRPIDSLLDAMRGSHSLKYRAEYVGQLEELREKYMALYGPYSG